MKKLNDEFTSNSNYLDKSKINEKDLTTNQLHKELELIDKMFEKDLTNLNLIEQENTEVLKNLNYKIQGISNDKSHSLNNNKEIEINAKDKLQIILDKGIILDSITSNPYFDKCLINNVTEEDRAKILLSSKIFYLMDKRLTKIANLEIYENLTELYLQRNFIKKIEGLECLKNLKILSFFHNILTLK